jgi:3-methyladenine DNA glycosylase/8-oxoguanine DNA glycosylase
MPAASLEIQSIPPFDFGLSLAYFRRRAGELVDVVDGGRYRRVLSVNRERLLVEVLADSKSGSRLTVTILSGDSRYLPEAAASIRRAFGLEDRLDVLSAELGHDPRVLDLISHLQGLRLVRTQTPFEALVWAIVGQQISLTMAFRLKAALVQHLGAPVDFGGRTYWGFPEPEGLAAADEALLAATGLGRRKAAALTGVAHAVATGELDFASLALLPRAEAEAVLKAWSGVGPWTAHYTLLRGLGDTGAFPASDLGLRAAAGRLFGDGAIATPALMRRLSQEWGEWRGYVAFYLWNELASRAA